MGLWLAPTATGSGCFTRIDATFNQEANTGNIGGWFNGDFDGNGKVDGTDYALIDAAFNSQGSSLRPAVGSSLPPRAERSTGGKVLRF